MAHGSAKAVYAAVIANSLVMVAKFFAFAVTGSPAMLSEGIHSVADVGNQSLLIVGLRKSSAPPTPEFPYGFHRDRFVWALISAAGIFFLGCGVTIYHGVSALLHPHPPHGAIGLSVGVLVFAAVVEGFPLYLAIRTVRRDAAGRPLWRYLTELDDPMAAAVLLEDSAAVLGVLLALVGILVAHLTGSPVFDAAASIAIGVLMGVMALVLAHRNRELLIGTSPADDATQRGAALLRDDPAVEQVRDVKAVVLGSDIVRFKAEVQFDGEEIARRALDDLDVEEAWEGLEGPDDLRDCLVSFGDQVVEELADTVDRLEAELAEEVPDVAYVDLETD